MKDYLKEREYVIERLWFDYLGVRHQGRGVMKWKPDTGLHLEAFLERKRDLPPKINFGGVGFIPQQSIRMYLGSGRRAIAPSVPIGDRLDIIMEKRISINLRRVIFFFKSQTRKESEDWFCSALYDVGGKLALPDTVRYEEWLEDKQISRKQERAGINLKDESGVDISGYMRVGNHLELHTKLSQSQWPRSAGWIWPEATGLALSMLSGRNICLLAREVYRGGDKYVEMKARQDVHSLSRLAPFGTPDILDKHLLLWLTRFFVRDFVNDSKYYRICKNVFRQMAAADQQRTWQARELLLGTILEAFLRSLYERPFGRRKLKIKPSLSQFRDDYLSSDWNEACDRAIEVFGRLRDRNAHPDWLVAEGGGMSDDRIDQSLDDMIFLSRFYGYMILAISGIKDLKPEFPKSHKEWGPLMTITRGQPK